MVGIVLVHAYVKSCYRRDFAEVTKELSITLSWFEEFNDSHRFPEEECL